jgi:coenzyme F420-reducing hydrogenase delta subunit
MQAGGNMETLKTRLRTGSRNAAKRVARVTGVDEEFQRLRDRVATLEQEVQEARRLHQRLAELTDVVTEVLVPAADRDDDKIRAILAKYNRTSF